MTKNDFIKKYKLPKDAKYSDILHEILKKGKIKTLNKFGTVTEQNWKKILKPNSLDIDVPKFSSRLDIGDRKMDARFQFENKATAQGIMQTLRESVTDNVTKKIKQSKNPMDDHPSGRRRISRELNFDIEQGLIESFEPYQKPGKSTGLPQQIQNIVVTEMRSAISDFREDFVEDLIANNPGLKIEKEWIHHPELSHNPRKGHAEQNHNKIPYKEKFRVNIYTSRGGHEVFIGREDMSRPHDPDASASNVVNCHCEAIYSIVS